MKKYYVLTPMNDVEYIGEFQEFKEAWDFLEYSSNIRYVWLVSENSINKLYTLFGNILENNNDRIQEFVG
jgi:hypothetical protein